MNRKTVSQLIMVAKLKFSVRAEKTWSLLDTVKKIELPMFFQKIAINSINNKARRMGFNALVRNDLAARLGVVLVNDQLSVNPVITFDALAAAPTLLLPLVVRKDFIHRIADHYSCLGEAVINSDLERILLDKVKKKQADIDVVSLVLKDFSMRKEALSFATKISLDAALLQYAQETKADKRNVNLEYERALIWKAEREGVSALKLVEIATDKEIKERLLSALTKRELEEYVIKAPELDDAIEDALLLVLIDKDVSVEAKKAFCAKTRYGERREKMQLYI